MINMVPTTKIYATYVICCVLTISIISASKCKLDLSYTNYLTPAIISCRCENFITNHVSSNHINKNSVIDISNANLGNFIGLDYLQISSLQSVYPNSTTTTSTSDDDNISTTAQIGIDLILRSNRLTSQHVATFLNEICDTDQSNASFLNQTKDGNITVSNPAILDRKSVV